MKDITKHYPAGDITIVWKPGLCIHSAICFRGPAGQPAVFNPKERPWIKPEAASAEALMLAIDACPSGALSYFRNDGKAEDETVTVQAETIAEIVPNGPLMVYGNVTVRNKATGEEQKKDKVTAFCRCGLSGNKPYCDGSHIKGGFQG